MPLLGWQQMCWMWYCWFMHLIWDGLVQIGTSRKSGLISPTSRESQSPLTTCPDIPRPPSLLQLQIWSYLRGKSCQCGSIKRLPGCIYMGATPHYLALSIYLFSRSGHYHHLDKAPLPTSYYARPQIRETGARSHLENGRSSSSRSM